MFSLLNCETTTKRRISDTPDIQDLTNLRNPVTSVPGM
jgi:hypothetical protein